MHGSCMKNTVNSTDPLLAYVRYMYVHVCGIHSDDTIYQLHAADSISICQVYR